MSKKDDIIDDFEELDDIDDYFDDSEIDISDNNIEKNDMDNYDNSSNQIQSKFNNKNNENENQQNYIQNNFSSNLNNNLNENSIQQNNNLPNNSLNQSAGELENNGNTNQQNDNGLTKSSDKNGLKEDNNYKKTSSGREAFSRRLDDKDYYKNKKNETAERLKNAKTNLANKKKSQEDAKKKVSDAKEKLAGSNNDNEKEENKQGLKDAKKEEKGSLKDTLNAKKELRQSKKDLLNVKKDNLKSKAFAAKNPVEAAKMVAIKLLKKIRNILIIKVVLPITIFLLLMVIIIDSIFEVFEKVDQVMTGVANFHEKLDNFLNGLGFNDSEQAFYNEIDDLNKKYNNAIDVPLLMATIFYDDMRNGLDPEGDMVSSASIEDESDNDIFLVALAKKTIVKWYNESNVTVGKDGLRYTSNKVYRLRKLASHQFSDNKYTPETISLGKYISKYISILGDDILTLIKDILVMILNSFNIGNTLESFKETLFDDEDFFMTDTGQAYDNLFNHTLDVFKDIFGGLFTQVTDINILCESNEVDSSEDDYIREGTEKEKGIHLVCVTHKVHTKYDMDEDAYFNYLREEYIPRMPEFQKELMGIAKNSSEYDEAVENIIKNIKLYRDSYNEYYKTSDQIEKTKGYTDKDKGNIKPEVINNLALPVEVPDGFTPNFTGNNAYGFGVGTSLNKGIYLNETSAGVRAGDNVYSVYDGEVTALPDSYNKDSSFDRMLFIGDTNYKTIESDLNSLGSDIYVASVEAANPSHFSKIVKNGYGSIQTSYGNGNFALPDSVSNISIMFGLNSIDEKNELIKLVEELHNRYPKSIIYINSMYNVSEKYSEDYARINEKIADFNNDMKSLSGKYSYVRYVDLTNGINETGSGLNNSVSDDGITLNTTGNRELISNLKSEVSNKTGNENLVIKHIMDLNGTTYQFYTQYGNIDIDENIKVGTVVEKGQKIGVIDSSGSLYFEFDESSGEALNPVGLYVKNYNYYSTLEGEFDISDKKDLVGILYTTSFDAVMKITNNNPGIISETSNYVENGYYCWGTPEGGFYKSSDKNRIKKHMRQLSEAGVDFIVIDNTNATMEYIDENYLSDPNSYWNLHITYPMTALLDAIVEMRENGEPTPYVVNWIRSATAVNVPASQYWNSVEAIYNQLYTNEKYKNVWVYWDGNPFIITTARMNTNPPVPITTRSMWTYSFNVNWSYLQLNNKIIPSASGNTNSNGILEHLSVSTAVQSTYMSFTNTAKGRRNGRTFNEQWQTVFEKHPKIVTITWWNEWCAQAIPDTYSHTGQLVFTDEYNYEYSRDIEPMEGGAGSKYYDWMKQYISDYKNGKTCPALYDK